MQTGPIQLEIQIDIKSLFTDGGLIHANDIVLLCRLLSTVVYYRRPRINVEIKSEVL